jgi:hypothetical protein
MFLDRVLSSDCIEYSHTGKDMKALIQRVRRCSVSIGGVEHSSIGYGMLILLGVKQEDKEEDSTYLAERCAALRIFEDPHGKMNLSVHFTVIPREETGRATVLQRPPNWRKDCTNRLSYI